jgi:hypothetical protein
VISPVKATNREIGEVMTEVFRADLFEKVACELKDGRGVSLIRGVLSSSKGPRQELGRKGLCAAQRVQ